MQDLLLQVARGSGFDVKDARNYYSIFWVFRDSGKDNRNFYNGIWGLGFGV